MEDQPEPEASDAFVEKRAALRQKLLTGHILEGDTPLVFQGTFGGGGDSGSFYGDTGNGDVDQLFSDAIEQFVTFDWYNNDGGGGDITWDVRTDRITINGYYNETTSTDVMVGEEF